MNPVDQPSSNPTRKLTAATLGAAFMAISGIVVRNVWPEWYDTETWLAVTPIIVFALGYVIKDLPNA